MHIKCVQEVGCRDDRLAPCTRNVIHSTQTIVTYRTVTFAHGDLAFIGKMVGLLTFRLERVRLVSGILGLHEDAFCLRPSYNTRGFRELVDR